MAFPVAAVAAAALPIVMQMFGGNKNQQPAPTPVGSGGGGTQFTPSASAQQAQGQARMTNLMGAGMGAPRGSEMAAMTQTPAIAPAPTPDLSSNAGNASSMWANAGNAARIGSILNESFKTEMPELPTLPGAQFSSTQYVPTAARFGGQRLRTLYGV